jgi:hypothetical protein
MSASGVSAGPQGNPSTELDGSLRGISAPVSVGVESAGLAALVQQQQRDLRGRQWMEDGVTARFAQNRTLSRVGQERGMNIA